MNDAKSTITLLACCCIILTISPSSAADFVGVTTVIKDDPATVTLCDLAQDPQGLIPFPLSVCNAFAVFDDPADRLWSVGCGEMQVYNGESPDVFFQHQFGNGVFAPMCFFVGFIPSLICDTFITIGYKCGPDPVGTDATSPDAGFSGLEFAINGHVIGGWFAVEIPDGSHQGDAGTWPDLQVLFLQSSVAQGLSMSGDIDIFWEDGETGEIIAEVDVSIECDAVDQNPCECDNGRVTLCHIPRGNLDNGRTITVGCAAGDKHLAHGDVCGPCE